MTQMYAEHSSVLTCDSGGVYGNYGQINQTQVVLSNSDFKILGSYTGVATEKKSKISVKNKEGLISLAKKNLLAQAKAEGIELYGSRTLINVCVDVVQNPKKVTATISAEIVEFTK